jgi:hypothetical protein
VRHVAPGKADPKEAVFKCLIAKKRGIEELVLFLRVLKNKNTGRVFKRRYFAANALVLGTKACFAGRCFVYFFRRADSVGDFHVLKDTSSLL